MISLNRAKKLFLAVVVASAAGITLAAPAQAKSIGLAWYGQAGSMLVWEKGFLARMKEIAPDVQIEVVKEIATLEEMGSVIQRFDKEKDGLVLFRSYSAEYLLANPVKKPVFVGGMSNPAHIGLIKSLDAPEGNVTGATHDVSVKAQLQSFLAVVPTVKKLMFIQEAGHPISESEGAASLAACKQINLTCSVEQVKTPEDLVAVIKAKRDGVDGIVVGRQGFIVDSTAQIVEAAGPKPVFTNHDRAVKAGALVGIAPDLDKLGRLLADNVVQVLIKGKPIKEVPVATDLNPTLFVNIKTAGKLGLDIPLDILSTAQVIQ
jgi:putative ABC transport system substrate-binding protein